ncbi:MAG TPA: HD domain-containing phosphohydrolase, partial [Solirubrobacterales bacterium]|nr:HD domain-containing phosphohydrolase [Solirubrobacterales bacterium]
MEAQSTATMRRLPQVLAMTLVVIGVPVLLVTLLVELFGTPDDVVSILVLTGVATGLSLCVSYLGAAFWTHRSRAGDVLFADLTLWGWLRRYRGERRLATATLRLGLREEPPAEQLIQLNSGERTQLLERLSGILESRHPDMYGHSRRVARHAAAIAEQLDLPPEEVARIRTAAAVHDVGKIYVSASILEKPGKLTTFEFGEIQRHAEFGAQMVAALGDPELTLMVRHHHERYDGSGYPAGLVGEEIPLGARIIAVADTFD